MGKRSKMLGDLQVLACCTSSINSCFRTFKFKFTNVSNCYWYGISLGAHKLFVDEDINSRSHSLTLPSGADRNCPDVSVNTLHAS